jgi:uridine kinase
MAAFVRADTRIEPWLLTRDQFQAECERMNQDARCLTAGGESTFTLFRSENTAAFLGTPLLPSTGRIQAFGLVPWKGGMILLLPHGDDITILPPFVPYSKLFRVFHEFGDWERILGVSQAADLNRSVATGAHSDLIKIAEGLHEKKVAQIADTIARRRKQLRLILIAGPSSSGKTTFTKRLAIQLRVIGLVPLVVSLDDYFLDRDKTPRNVEGKPDYETLEAVDVPRFYRDLSDLLAGRPVRLPRYDFLNGLRTPGLSVTLPPRQPVLVEGLHALNPRLADALPSKVMYRIYASALTQMNITDHMRFPTSDIRLLRRLVRDVRFRSHPASDTLTAWPMVRRGEERHIFPYQDDCHVVFNSALTYEPAVLRTFAEPLLQRIPAGHAAFPEVLRLLQLLRCFSPISPDEVPPTSILREFIGGSSFKY